MPTLNLQFLPGQLEVIKDQHRFKILICGRRWGKSILASYRIIIAALSKPNGTFFLVSPSYSQTSIIWRMIKRNLPKEYISRTMEGEKYIELKNGSLIFAKSGDNPDCYDDKTEILTENGWKLFKNLEKTERILTLNPENYRAEWKTPIRYICEDYSGDMFAFKSKKQDLLVTPTHKFFVESADGVKKFKTLDYITSHDRIPLAISDCEYEDKEEITENDCAIMGFYLSEGTAYGNNGGDITKRKGNYSVMFCQTEGTKGGIKGDVRSKFKDILKTSGYNVHETRVGIYVLNKQLWSQLVILGNARTKYIPKIYKNLPKHKLEILLHWLLMGDGIIRENGERVYYTISKQLADDVQEIAIKCGYPAEIRIKKNNYRAEIKGRTINTEGFVYQVSILHSKYSYFSKTGHSYISKSHYTGKIYCVEVENHIILVRRNGKICFSGNSLRGEGLDGCVLDEAAMLKPEVWHEAIRPALSDKNGWALIISCITDDSYILTPMGITTYRDEINITGMEKTEIPCGKLVYGSHGMDKSSFSWENGETETIKIVVEGGYCLEGTPNHPIIAKDSKYKKFGSWIELKDITKSCFVSLQLNQQIYGNKDEISTKIKRRSKERHRIQIPEKVTQDLAYFIGILLGNGFIGDKSISITSKDKEIINFCHDNSFGLNFYDAEDETGCHHLTAGSAMFVRFLISLGYKRKLAKKKTIPKECLKWSKGNICALLQGLFDTDGSCVVRTGYKGKQNTRITFVTTSKELHLQVKYLLLNMGIVTSSHDRDVMPTKKVVSRSHVYILEISDQIAIKRFYEQIGFRIKRKQDNIIVQPDKKYGDHKRIYTKHDGFETKWCRVKEIKQSKAKTYDLHIPKYHSFTTNGFISHNTPKGKNWLYDLFLRGMDETQREFKSFSYPSWANPILKPEEIDEMRKNLPELSFRQEILAEFIEGGGVVFRNVDNCMISEPESPITGEYYIIGVDLGRHEDFTFISVGKMSECRQVYIERFNRSDWDYIKERIRYVHFKYNKGAILIDSTGYGDPIYEDLGKEGLNISGYNLNSISKAQLIENMQLLLENNQIQLIKDKQLSLELSAYNYTILPSGNVRYEAPKGFHDDCVIGTALMAMGFQGQGGGIIGEIAEEPTEAGNFDEMDNAIDDEWEDLTLYDEE